MLTKTTLEEIQQLTQQLSFTRFNVSDKENNFEEPINKALEIVKKEGDVIAQSELKMIYEKIGLWFLFNKRNKENALKYLSLYKSLFSDSEKTSLDYANVCNLIGHAYTIDGTYEDSSLFDESNAIYKKLLENEKNSEIIKQIELDMAFAWRYIGLYHHRKSNPSEAQKYFKAAAEKYDKYRNNAPDVNLAECWHLIGVSLKNEKKFNEALQKLNEAYQMEQEYCQLHGTHFMLFITMQSIAETKLKFAESITDNDQITALLEEGEKLLKAAYQPQITFFKEKNNADVAKTLQFWGDILCAQKRYNEAIEKYLETLEIKLAVYHDPKHFLVKFTQDSFTKALKMINKEIESRNEKYLSEETKKNIKEIFQQLSNIGKSAQQELAKFYYSYAQFLLEQDRKPEALKSLKKANDCSSAANGEDHEFRQKITEQISRLEKEIPTKKPEFWPAASPQPQVETSKTSTNEPNKMIYSPQ